MQKTPQKLRHQNLIIIWGALLFSQIIYGAVLLFMIDDFELANEPSEALVPILSSVALIALFAGYFLPKKLIGAQKLDLSQGQSLDELCQAIAAPFIMRLALFDSVTVMGFVLAFTTGEVKYFYPFALVGIFSHLTNFPSPERIKNLFT